MTFDFKNTVDIVQGNALYHESVNQNGSGNSRFYGNQWEDIPEENIYHFYNSFIVSNVDYEHEPIVFKLTWAPPLLLEEPIIVSITEM